MMKTKLLLMLLAFGLAAGIANANLLKNPGFEEGTFAAQNVPDEWSLYWASYYSAFTWFDDADGAHRGSKYIKMASYNVSASTAWLEQTVDATEGQEYVFSVWAKCPQEDSTSKARAWIDWWGTKDDGGLRLCGGGWLPLSWDVGNEWTYGEFGTVTAPETTVLGVFYLAGILENGPMGILFDDVYIGIPLPSSPYPECDALVPIGDVELSWTNLDPNDPDGSVYVDVLFGTEPNETDPAYDMELLILDPVSGQDVSSVTVEDLAEGTYYWQVNSYLYGDPAVVDYNYDIDNNDPNDVTYPNLYPITKGHIWSFTTSTNLPPSVMIDTPDMITWQNEPVQLDATIVDVGDDPVFTEWMVSINNGTAVAGVTFDPDEFAEDPEVSIDQGYYSSANITNPSFEKGLTGWDQIGRGHGTWAGTYGTKKYITASDGYLLAYTNSLENNGADAGLSQILSETFAADTTYTLTVDVANDGYFSEQVDYRVQLLAGGAILAEDNNEQYELPIPQGGGTAPWYTSEVVYEYDEVADANKLGEPLEIRLLAINGTQEMSFDNVHLTADPAFLVQPGTTYEFKITASDALGSDSATIGIDVYETACQAAVGAGLRAENPSDIDGDCYTDIHDLAAMALTWLEDQTPIAPFIKP
jgi:hypothetical protein